MIPDIEPMSAVQLYSMMGIYGVMEPDTEVLMREQSEAAIRTEDIARGHHWHTSFHASEFGGDSPDVCPRFLAYRMMDFAPVESMPPWVTATGDVGKAGELTIARAWFEGGRALAIPEDHAMGEHQLVFEKPSHWMSASTDLPILLPGWRKPHIVEIKGKAQEVLEDMRAGKRQWDDGHRLQLLASLGLAEQFDWGSVTVCSKCWRILFADIFSRLKGDLDALNPALSPARLAEDNFRHCLWCAEEAEWETFDLEQPDTGSIYYWSRSWPRGKPGMTIGQPIEYFFTHDQQFIDTGLETLASVRESFLLDEIPAKPKSFAWSVGPCAKCKFKKKACKPDFTGKTAELSASAGVEWTQELRPSYDPQEARERVLSRWRT